MQSDAIARAKTASALAIPVHHFSTEEEWNFFTGVVELERINFSVGPVFLVLELWNLGRVIICESEGEPLSGGRRKSLA